MNIVFTAVASGIGVLLVGNLPWLLLAQLNQRILPVVPWAAVPMAAYLGLYWKFISGAIGPSDTAAWRREQLRANPPGGIVWSVALLTGLTGFAALLAFAAVMGRFVMLPASAPLTALPGMPPATMFLLLVVSSVVAGVTEEAGFRGYMQTGIERRFGLAVAILINGTIFGLLHFPNHAADAVTMLPYYLAVAAVYSGVTCASGSILPALALHCVGDVWSLTRLWLTGRAEWAVGASAPLVWQTGVDRGLIVALLLLLAFSSVAMWLGVQTARLARTMAGSCAQ